MFLVNEKNWSVKEEPLGCCTLSEVRLQDGGGGGDDDDDNNDDDDDDVTD
jgi:hypothetical protein